MENHTELKPRVAVVGSCVSRDVFNRAILGEDYQSQVEVVNTVYQTSLPSLVREEPVDACLPLGIKPNHQKFIEQEWSGDSIRNLLAARPDVIIVDFFADIHFGIVRRGVKIITRNTMAFDSYARAQEYFDHETSHPESFQRSGEQYMRMAVRSMDRFLGRVSVNQRMPMVVVNSARYATEYLDAQGILKAYGRNLEHLVSSNAQWSALDSTVADEFSLPRIEYSRDLFVGDPNHKWGLHPVHYQPAYYKYLWSCIQKLITVR